MAVQRRKFFIWNSILPAEEDMTTEFKGHRNLVRLEVPPYATEQKTEKASRKHTSR